MCGEKLPVTDDHFNCNKCNKFSEEYCVIDCEV